MNSDFTTKIIDAFRNLLGGNSVWTQPVEEKIEVKVSDVAIRKYQQICHKSAKKSNGSLEVIEAKIVRAVNLGRLLHIRKSGIRVVGYYNLNFIVQNYEVIDIMERSSDGKRKTDKFVRIDPTKKKEYGKL